MFVSSETTVCVSASTHMSAIKARFTDSTRHHITHPYIVIVKPLQINIHK